MIDAVLLLFGWVALLVLMLFPRRYKETGWWTAAMVGAFTSLAVGTLTVCALASLR